MKRIAGSDRCADCSAVRGRALRRSGRCSDRLESNHGRRRHGRPPRTHRHGRYRTGAGRRARCRAGDRQAVRAVSLRGRASLRAAAQPPWPQRHTTCWSACIPRRRRRSTPSISTTWPTTASTGDPGSRRRTAGRRPILPLRRVNPNPLPPPFVGGNEIGVWRPTPSFLGNPPAPAPFSPMAAPWMAELRSLHAHEPHALSRRSRRRR